MYINEQHILEIDSVELSFGERQILTNVYLRVDTGKITALLGRGGSGKSSLMRILFNQLKPTNRSMRIDSIWYKKFSHSQVLYLPQSCSLPNYLKISRVLKDFDISLDAFLSFMPSLEFAKDMKIKDLSGGEKRLIEIYIILKSKTQFVMLDEPFSQIMPLHIESIKSLILEETKNKGILITDHMYRNVIDIADSTYIIDNQTVYLTKKQEDLVKYGYLHRL